MVFIIFRQLSNISFTKKSRIFGEMKIMFMFLMVGPFLPVDGSKFNVCQAERCFQCAFVVGSSHPGLFRFRDNCTKLLRHANCCQRFKAHTGALVPAKQPETLPVLDDSCFEVDAKFAIMLLTGVTVMALTFVVIKKIAQIRPRQIIE